jgi:hypothetical protein
LSDETVAIPWQRSNEALLLTGIADRPPGNIHTGRQRCVGYGPSIPNGVDQVVFAYNALPVADQVIKQLKYLRRD